MVSSCPDIAEERAAELDIPHIIEIENDCDQEPCDLPNTSKSNDIKREEKRNLTIGRKSGSSC